MDGWRQHTVYFDNFFTNYNILRYLGEKNMRATGTVRDNRTSNCPLKSIAETNKGQKGVYDSVRQNAVIARIIIILVIAWIMYPCNCSHIILAIAWIMDYPCNCVDKIHAITLMDIYKGFYDPTSL